MVHCVAVLYRVLIRHRRQPSATRALFHFESRKQLRYLEVCMLECIERRNASTGIVVEHAMYKVFELQVVADCMSRLV